MLFLTVHTLETARCTLRIPTPADHPHVFSATRFPNFLDGMPWDMPAKLDELDGPLARTLAAWREGSAFTFTIERRADAAFLGRISIRPAAGPASGPGRWNIGFWLHPDHQRKGYAREAARAVLEFGFRQLAANEIEACYATWNVRSERLLEHLGMRFVEPVPEGFQKRGVWVAENRMAVTRESWTGNF